MSSEPTRDQARAETAQRIVSLVVEVHWKSVSWIERERLRRTSKEAEQQFEGGSPGVHASQPVTVDRALKVQSCGARFKQTSWKGAQVYSAPSRQRRNLTERLLACVFAAARGEHFG